MTNFRLHPIFRAMKYFKVGKPEDCWNWTGGKCEKGYGLFKVNSRLLMRAHRFIRSFLTGENPKGLVSDHLCRNHSCVNPSHIEFVENLENVRRGNAGHNWRAKTHCPKGHPYSGDNVVYAKQSSGRGFARSCRTCRRAISARTNARMRGEKNAKKGAAHIRHF